MKKLIAVVEIPACNRDYSSSKGVIFEWDENSRKLFIYGKEREWKSPNPPAIGDNIYSGECFSSSETCAHCQSTKLYGTIIELRPYKNETQV